jgi:hypothetical protein
VILAEEHGAATEDYEEELEELYVHGPRGPYYCEVDMKDESIVCSDKLVKMEGEIYQYQDDENCLVVEGYVYGTVDDTQYDAECFKNECTGYIKCDWNIWVNDDYDTYYSCTNGECSIDC